MEGFTACPVEGCPSAALLGKIKALLVD